MRLRNCFVVVQLGLLVVSGCAAPVSDAGDEIEVITPGGKADLADRVLTQEDDGAIVRVTEGQAIVVRLRSNPSTGHSWQVETTDRTFGYPSETYEPDPAPPGLVGGGGTAVLRWETSGFLSQVGTHDVTLAYVPPGLTTADAVERMSFTVDVQAAPAADRVTITQADSGRTIDVVKGRDIVLRLPSNPSTGHSWAFTAVSRSFGYPASTEFESDAPPGIVGAGGFEVMTWHTTGTFPSLGRHPLRLEYRGPSGAVAETFSATVNLVATAPSPGVTITAADNGRTLSARQGQPIVLRLEANASAGTEWVVTRTDRTFGYPATTEIETPSYPPGTPRPLGASHTQVMTWRTDPGALRFTGRHTVQLEKRGPTGRVYETFSFTVDISE